MERAKKKFFNSGYWRSNACLSCGPADYSWYTYCEGFYNSGNILAASMLNEDFISSNYKEMLDDNNNYLFDIHKDTCVFPMVFLYSHYIEISLKQMILRIDKLLNIKDYSEVTDGHCLFSLCLKLQDNYNKLLNDEFWTLKNNNDSKELLKLIKYILPKLQDIDEFTKKSITSRYPVNNNNEIYLLHEKPLNIETFVEEMIKIHNFFEMLNFQLEMLGEYLQEYSSYIYT